MRVFDFTPFYRSTVGFDRMFSMLEQLEGVEGPAPSYPPYNIERVGENAYSISFAVAGFAETDLLIEVKENTLTIRGEKQPIDGDRAVNMLHQGIPARPFQRSFQLAEHVAIKGASLENGLLDVELVRKVPEAMQSRVIPIASSSDRRKAKPTKIAA
ncbi:heat-shock protein IbpA [Labrys miyagiensis]|uniref:Heat-shock protein IbpA n=1 Tax=Labrys miyagiensis TaxID=346912 RepID=A0ABQ6CP52_9HYPH|nr:Hsp20 family protein [Labrys miyagiensis]GLS21548.1 heat-shock protein IbpA [Labrys miyagiensis]